MIITLRSPVLVDGLTRSEIHIRAPGRDVTAAMSSAAPEGSLSPDLVQRFGARLSGWSALAFRQLSGADLEAVSAELHREFRLARKRHRTHLDYVRAQAVANHMEGGST